MTSRWKRTNKTKTANANGKYRAIWLVYRTDTNARGFWLVKRTLEWKNFMPENVLEINRYFALTSYCNTIGQSKNAFFILGFLWRENGEAMFWSFHPLADKTNKEHLPKPFFKVIRKSLAVAYEGRLCSLSLFKCHVFRHQCRCQMLRAQLIWPTSIFSYRYPHIVKRLGYEN